MKNDWIKVWDHLFQGYNLFGWLLVAAVFLTEGFRTKMLLMRAGLEFNNWDMFLSLLTDPYLILFFVIPLSLYWSVMIISQDMDYQFLIRWHSYRRWAMASLKHYWQYMGILLTLWVLSAGYLLIGVHFSSSWSLFSKENNPLNTLRPLAYQMNPIEALLIQLILFGLTGSFLHLFLLMLRTWSNRFAIMTMSVLMFIWGIIAFKLFPNKFSFLAPTTYLSATQNINFWGKHWWWVILLEAGIILLTLWMFKGPILQNGQKLTIQNYFYKYWGQLLYILIGTFGILSVVFFPNSSVSNMSFENLLAQTFYGSNSNFISYDSFLRYAVLTLGILYFIQLKLGSEFDGFRFYKLIRYHSLNRWAANLFFRTGIEIMSALLTWFLIVVVAGVLTGVSFRMTPKFWIILFHYLVNGTLQVLFYSLVMFVIFWNSRQIANQGIIVISCLLVLMLPHINTSHIIPIGLSAMSYLTLATAKQVFVTLLCFNVLAVGVILYQFRKSARV